MYHILVVDDESRIRSVIRKYAEIEGHQVTEAGDGMEAVLLCRKNQYDMIIMDTPAILGTSDTCALAALDKVSFLTVVRLNRTDKKKLDEAMQTMDTVSAKLLGIVLNSVK
jgi:CheY-like chemotaxis protein